MKMWVSTSEIAELIGTNPQTILKWVAAKLLKKPNRSGATMQWRHNVVRAMVPKSIYGVGARKARRILQAKRLSRLKELRISRQMHDYWSGNLKEIIKMHKALCERVDALEKTEKIKLTSNG